MATKKKAAKAKAITNLDRFENLVLMLKEGNGKGAEYNKLYKHLKSVLTPVQKGSTIKEIIALFKKGKTKQQIIAAGYNKSTVARQIKEYTTRTTYAITIANGEDEEDGEE